MKDLIMESNKNYKHLKSKLHELIDSIIPDEPTRSVEPTEIV